MIYCNREFRPVNIPGYSNYMVSKEGDIYSIDRNRLLKHAIDEYGTHKMRMQTDAHCEQHKFKVSNIVRCTWDIIIDDKMFPNLITVDKPYLERENRTEMTLDGVLYKNIAIPGFNRYMINDTGDVYTKRSGKFMVPRADKDGYLYVPMYNTITKERPQIRLATAVLNTFGGPHPEDMIDPTVDHIDGNKTNNHISNLRWLTRSENSSDLFKHTYAYKDVILRPRCSEELQSKYREGVIKDYFDNGMRGKDVCEKYHITQKLFDDIREPIMRILFSKGSSFRLHNIFDENKELPGFTNFSEEEITIWQK